MQRKPEPSQLRGGSAVPGEARLVTKEGFALGQPLFFRPDLTKYHKFWVDRESQRIQRCRLTKCYTQNGEVFP